MKQYDLVIKNGLAVLEDEVAQLSIAVKDGKIAAAAPEIKDDKAEKVWDAAGSYIFPGAIDTHVHFSEPGRAHWEGFESGSNMMAAGGCTTYFDMPLNGIPSTTSIDALEEKAGIGKEKSVVDFGLWGGLVPGNEQDIAELAEGGVIGFKAFLSPTGNEEFERADDETLLRGMREISQTGKLLALHSESASIVEYLEASVEQATASAYSATRPIEAEAEAVQRALYYAKLTNCPLHFVHISSAAAVLLIQSAKQQGMDVTLETCPHYLIFNEGDLEQKGAVAKCAPPLRRKEEQHKLIQLLCDGAIDFVTSDHSPCLPEMKETSNLFKAWGGISGGQFTLLTMIEIALKYKLPFTEVARLTAAAPAERFHLGGRKGKIKTGYDADFAVISFEKFEVTKNNFHAKHKISLYEGHTFPCRVEAAFLRGFQVYSTAIPSGGKPQGQWIK
ncbi:allantoinase AllB [Alteribacillus sp. HJP-4]|uniref:allantoinase AllB n=1 Tax=Alteribacillus sp. HJP-4 TaxID=2775394 RepID=UPI0035CD1D65